MLKIDESLPFKGLKQTTGQNPMEKNQTVRHPRLTTVLGLCSILVLTSALPIVFDIGLSPQSSVATGPKALLEGTETSPENAESTAEPSKRWETIRSPNVLVDRLQKGWQPDYLQLESVSDRFDLSVLEALPNLEGLSFRGLRLTTGELSGLPALTQLKILSFYDCRFEPGAIASLPQLKSLQSLNFMLSELTDDDFGIVADRYGMGITRLDLFCTRMSDAAAPHLVNFPCLQEIDLQGTMTTNLCFEYLQQLKCLRQVRVRLGGPVNKDNARQLQKAVPGVMVHWGS